MPVDKYTFFEANRNGDLKIVEQGVKQGLVNDKTEQGWDPLNLAVFWRQTHIVKYLLEHGANVNAIRPDGWTPFHCAVFNEHIPILKELIKYKPNIHTRRKDGKSPLDTSRYFNFETTLKKLLNGEDVPDNKKNYQDQIDEITEQFKFVVSI